MKKNIYILSFISIIGILFCNFKINKIIKNPEDMHLLIDGMGKYYWDARYLFVLLQIFVGIYFLYTVLKDYFKK
ncbi:hypothetical protein UT300005_20110 [Clostridium sp. CTA-5]